MAIADKLNTIKTGVIAIKNMCINKGFDKSSYPSQLDTLTALATFIRNELVKPSGNLTITENGSYNVKSKETVAVNVPTGVDLVFGTITGVSNAASITIPEAIGKNNICLFYTQTTTAQYSGNGIITLLIISGQIYATYKSTSYTYKISDAITFDSSTGTLTTNSGSGARRFNSGGTSGKYSWFAW